MASFSGQSHRNLAIVLGSVAAATVLGVGVVYYYRRKNKNQRASSSAAWKPEKGDNKNKSIEEKSTKPPSLLDKAIALKMKGNEAFKAGQYDEAIKYYSDAINLCPANASPADLSAFYQNRAAAQEKLQNYAAVVEDCTKALEGNKRYEKAVLRRAKAYECMEKYKEAFRDFTAACILEGFNNFNTIAQAELMLKTLSSEQAKKTMADRAGRPIPLSKTFVDSYFVAFLEDPILNDLNSPVCQNGSGGGGDCNETNIVVNGEAGDAEPIGGYEKAKDFIKTKRYDDVVNACTEEIQRPGKYWLEATLLRATFYLIMGASEVALIDFDRVFKALSDLPPEDSFVRKLKSNAYIKRGSLYMQQGKKDECLADFKAAEEADPENADVYHHRAQLLVLLNELDEALSDYDKAVKLRPDFAVALAQRCYAKYRKAMATKDASAMHHAMVEFQSIIDKHSNCSEAFALYGQALVEHDDYEEAKRLFDKALEIAPTNANIHVHKALLLQAQSKHEDVEMSVKVIEEALKIDPYCEFAYEALGTTELQRGNIDRAMELFEKAIRFARTDLEMTHLFSLYESAAAQRAVAKEFSTPFPNLIPGFA